MYIEAITMPRVNYVVRVITRVMLWHASSHVNYTSLSHLNNDLHERFWHYSTRKTAWCHACTHM